MPSWKGTEPLDDPHDTEVAKAAEDDLAALRRAARSSYDSLATLLDSQPRWLTKDERSKLGSIQNACDVLSASTERAIQVLQRRSGRR